MPKKIDWEPIKRAYLVSGRSLEAIAAEFGVSTRAINGKSTEDGWAKSKEQAQPKPKPQPKAAKTRGELDEIATIEAAIADLSTGIADTDTPIKSKEAAATALVRLLEYRQKLAPTSAAELAERAIELGISPDDFLEQLRSQWGQ